MATTYNTAFGALPGYNEMLGSTNTTGGGQQTVYGGAAQQQRQTQQPAQTFAQMQQRGLARPPAPSAPQAQTFAQYGGSAEGQQMRQRLQQQLTEFGQAPSRYNTQAFQQIRGAQAANLQSEYQGQQKALDEELARRGLSASSIGGGRMGDLAGQQARALASLDAQLLQQAADTQAADRAQLLQAGQGFAELAGAQDLAQFEANRVAQAATFENQLRAAQFGQDQYAQAGQEAFSAAQAEESAMQNARQFDLSALGQTGTLSLDLQRLLGQQDIERAQLTGQLGGVTTLAGQQQAEQVRQFNIQQALAQQLGLGGLSVQQQEVGLKQQQIQNQASQFGMSLSEQQATRLQQYNISVQELSQETQKIQNQAAQFGQSMTAQQAQNTAQNNLEQQRINQATSEGAAQRNLQAQLQALQGQQQLEQLSAQRTTQFGLADAASMAEMQRLREANAAEQARLQMQLGAQATEGQAARNLQQLLQGRELDIQQSLGQQNIGVQQISALAQQELAKNQLFTQLAALLASFKPTV